MHIMCVYFTAYVNVMRLKQILNQSRYMNHKNNNRRINLTKNLRTRSLTSEYILYHKYFSLFGQDSVDGCTCCTLRKR